MGRTARANLPGVPFHLTSRVQGHEPLFDGLEHRVFEIVEQSVLEAGVRLLAWAIMPNHLHLVIVQGPLPLARCMQPMLRRLALLVMKTKLREGHVFERRYRAHACLNPFYLRNLIAYVHLNPVRAKLCADPAAYAWTSHNAYCAAAEAHLPRPFPAMIEGGLRLFATQPDGNAAQWRTSYLEFLRWRQATGLELQSSGGETAPDEEGRPWNPEGDAHWWREFGDSVDAAHARLNHISNASLRPDLRSIAQAVLNAEEPPMQLSWLRNGGRTQALVRVRRLVADRALTAGYAVYQVARFLNVSHTTVSRVASAQRTRAAAHRSATAGTL